MKIAILRKKYTFHGGAEGFSHAFMDLLVRQGHEVHVYAIAWEKPAAEKGIYFHKVPAVTVNSFFRDLTFALASRRQIMKERYDIIQSHDKTLFQDIYRAGDGCHIEWLRQRRKRAGVFGRLSMMLNPYHWLIRGLERSIFEQHRYRKIIAISEMVKRNIIDNYRVPANDIVVIYNGVDLERFHPGNRERYRHEVRNHYGVSQTAFVALFVGSGFERKGVRYLLEAAELLDAPVTIMIVGKGSAEKFRHIAGKQRVIFCGPQKQVEQYYAAADAFVFPTMYEPFGNVHLEALASGLPVITTENSGAAEIINPGRNGFIVRAPEDIRSIAEGMQKLLDGDIRRAMAGEARKTAEQFTFKRYAEEIMSLYAEVMKDMSTSRRDAA